MGEHRTVNEKHAVRLELERYSDVPVFNMKAMVQQSGVAAPTLRAWERRYAILSPERAQNEYRMYSERDIAIIRWLKERIDEGMSISQAIALFRHLQEGHHQLHREDVSLENTALSPSVRGTRLPIPQKSEQEVDEQSKQDASHAPLHNVQKSGAEETANISNTSLETYNMRLVQERLLVAFNALDEATASRLMASTLAIYPIEQVCDQLIKPALWEIGRLWEQGLITVSIEHFASNFFHGLLTNLFHALPPGDTGPLIILCCAPGEEHELAPLMLSLLLRRVGLHVAYLGQNIETNGLLQTVKQLSPALVCISATLPSCLEAVRDLGEKLQKLPSPRPALIFGGQGFEQRTELIALVPGVYLDADLQTITAQIKRMAFQQVEDQN
ncbi:MAG TPA: MerR family transcriptional regulator [Ktedonobacteraceae bacterium]|nr:MerR family transcriptional regulator [Ktedonobacteraceae bacterium]